MERSIIIMLSVVMSVLLMPEKALAYPAGNPCGLNTGKIILTMRGAPKPDLTFLIAHRGIHAQKDTPDYSETPENSLESLDIVASQCYEAAEVDIRSTSDKVLVLTHDTNWGREAVTPRNGVCCFDPWKQLNWNPVVAEHTFSETSASHWYLRNFKNWHTSQRFETPPSFRQVLNYYKSKQFAFVLFVDVKNKSDLTQAWKDVVDAGLTRNVVFKIGASNFITPGDFANFFSSHYYGASDTDAHHINFMPVYNTSDIADNSVGRGYGELGVLSSMVEYATYQQRTGINFFVAPEVNLKEPGGNLASLLVEAQTGTRSGRKLNVGIFHAIPAWGDQGKDGAGYYYKSDGVCCSPLADYLWNGGKGAKYRPDLYDGREQRSFILTHVKGNWISIITTDDVRGIEPQLSSLTRRNTLTYFR